MHRDRHNASHKGYSGWARLTQHSNALPAPFPIHYGTRHEPKPEVVAFSRVQVVWPVVSLNEQ